MGRVESREERQEETKNTLSGPDQNIFNYLPGRKSSLAISQKLSWSL